MTLGLLALIALGQEGVLIPRAPAELERDQAELNRIADTCRLPRSVFRLEASGLLHFQPGEHAKYQAIECALGHIRRSRLANTVSMGFVGNEAYAKDRRGTASASRPTD